MKAGHGRACLRYIRGLCLMMLMLCTVCADSGAQTNDQTDTAMISTLFFRGDAQKNHDSAIADYLQLIELSIKAKFPQYMRDIFLKIGERYASKGDYARALEYMNRAFDYKSPPEDEASIYSHIGWVYFSMGDYVVASEKFYEALACLKKMDEPEYKETGEYTIICRFLGMIHYRLHQNEKALYFLDEAERMALKQKNINYVVVIMLTKGAFYNYIDKPDSAQVYYSRAASLAHGAQLRNMEAEANTGLGQSLIESGKYKEALSYLRMAIQLGANMDKSSMLEASYYLGEALYHVGEYKEAEDVLVAALKQATSWQSNDNITKGYTALIAVYRATGQYKKALDGMDSLSVVKDSLINEKKARDINLLDIKFRTAEKDKQIAVQTGKIARKDTWILGISSGVVLLLVISAAIYLNTRHKQRLNNIHLNTLEQENKIRVLNAVVLGGDNERSNIARELHDGIGGMLSAAMMRFSSLRNENAAIPEMASYQEAMTILSEMGEEIRKTAHSLMPDALLKQSLPDAVQAFCNNVKASGALHIDFQYMGSFDELTQNYKLNLYRIIQELIKNTLQHAHATQASVQLLLNENVLIVSVEDNGVGFDTTNVQGGIGLHNIQTRVSNLDGHFALDSTPGKGTCVFMEFKQPLNS